MVEGFSLDRGELGRVIAIDWGFEAGVMFNRIVSV